MEEFHSMEVWGEPIMRMRGLWQRWIVSGQKLLGGESHDWHWRGTI